MLTTKPPLTQQEGANLNSSEDYYYYYEDIEHDAIIYRKNSPISDASLLKLQPRDYISQLDLVQQANKTTVSTNSTGIPLNKSTNQTDSKINTFLDRLEDLAKNSSSLPSLGQENISNTTQNSTQFVDKLVANKTENGNNTLIFIESGISELLEHAGGTNHHGNLNKTVNSTESKIPTFLDRLEGINETILEILAVTQASIPNVSTSTETLDQKTTNAFTNSSVEVLNEEYSTLVQESSVDTTEEEIVITTTDSPLETTTKSSTESLASLLNQIDAINNNLLVNFVESIKISDEDLGLNSSTSQLNALSTHVNRISEILTKLSSKDPFYSLNFRAVEKESEKVPILTGIMKQKLQVADIITRVRQNNKLFGINGNKIDASAPLDNIKKLIQKIRVQ